MISNTTSSLSEEDKIGRKYEATVTLKKKRTLLSEARAKIKMNGKSGASSTRHLSPQNRAKATSKRKRSPSEIKCWSKLSDSSSKVDLLYMIPRKENSALLIDTERLSKKRRKPDQQKGT